MAFTVSDTSVLTLQVIGNLATSDSLLYCQLNYSGPLLHQKFGTLLVQCQYEALGEFLTVQTIQLWDRGAGTRAIASRSGAIATRVAAQWRQPGVPFKCVAKSTG